MEFEIVTSTDNGLEKLVLRNPQEGCSAEILPAYGAMLHAFIINTPNGPHNVIDNYAGVAAIEKELDTSFKSSKLSPFVCRIPNGKYLYDGETFELQKKFLDGSAIHGLLYNKPFKKFSQFADEERASVALRYHYKEEDDGYPFDYTCEIRYTLLPNNTLQLQTTVTNLDDLEIPVCDGWHPYFTLGGDIDDLQLYFGANAILEFDERLVPTGRLLPYDAFASERTIADTRLDNCFVLNGDDSYAACTLRNPANGLQLNIFPDINYPFLQVFTPDHRKSIAIENLSGAPDAFNNKMGLIMLPPRHTQTFTVHYQLSCQ